MKIAGRIIQTRNIITNTPSEFEAMYKGLYILVTTRHHHGQPKEDHLTRYSMEAWAIKNGIFDVQTWEDCHNIKDAIRKTLEGACL